MAGGGQCSVSHDLNSRASAVTTGRHAMQDLYDAGQCIGDLWATLVTVQMAGQDQGLDPAVPDGALC